MHILVVIPARYGSTRLPGKPLAKIAGKTMLSRVVAIAKSAISQYDHVSLVVATDDDRITAHCDELDVACVMTPEQCATGTDRALLAAQQFKKSVDFVINLQGDTPLMPPDFITALIDAYTNDQKLSVVTPITQLSWDKLSQLRDNKLTTPFSGTTVIIDQQDNAVWFSKNIIPAIRNESKLRQTQSLSPVYRHIGLYGYQTKLLEKYVTWAPSHYERLEGLEQLRILENGHQIRCIKVDYQNRPDMSGVDSPEDIDRAEKLLAKFGDSL